MLNRLLSAFGTRFHPLHRLRRTRVFAALTRWADRPVWRRLPGMPHPVSLRLVANLSIILSPGHAEPEIRDTFATLLKHLGGEGCFWDVGANVGLFTWACASQCPGWEIVSFEPDEQNLVCLRRTAQRWPHPGQRTVPVAVAERCGRTQFLVDDLSGATGTLEPVERSFNYLHYGRCPPARQIETVTLDSLIAAGARPPDLVKIDVEGAEPRVLAGAAELVAASRPVLLLECYDHREELVSRLESCGYACYDSDTRTGVGSGTHNLLAVPTGRCSESLLRALAALGYPLDGGR